MLHCDKDPREGGDTCATKHDNGDFAEKLEIAKRLEELRVRSTNHKYDEPPQHSLPELRAYVSMVQRRWAEMQKEREEEEKVSRRRDAADRFLKTLGVAVGLACRVLRPTPENLQRLAADAANTSDTQTNVGAQNTKPPTPTAADLEAFVKMFDIMESISDGLMDPRQRHEVTEMMLQRVDNYATSPTPPSPTPT